jgi:hypothetical protein
MQPETSTTTPPRSRRRASSVALACAALALGACERGSVRRYLVAKERTPAAGSTTPAAVSRAPEDAAGGLRWTLPAGWKEQQGGGDMRHATLTPPGGGKSEVTVVRLAGPAGGELANVNRWRNQIGLPPLTEPQLTSARKVLRTAAGDLAVYDFVSEGEKKQRTIAGFTSVKDETWFLKLSGEAEAVASARPAFLELLGSLRLDAR